MFGKKSLTLVGVVLAISLTSCASSGGNDAGTESKGAVAMSYPGLNIQLWQDTLNVMEPIVEAAGYEFLATDPAWDVQKQIADWQGWIARGDVKAIMAWPVQDDAVVPVSAELRDSGIPLLGYASTWDGVVATMLIDNKTDGENVAKSTMEIAVEKYGADAAIDIGFFADRTTDLSRERSEGVVETIEAMMPNAVIQEFYAKDGKRDEAYNVTNSALAANPDIKVWITIGADPFMGMYQALLDSGVQKDDPDHILGTLDAVDEVLDVYLVPNSIARVAYILPAQDLGEANAALLLAAAAGEEVEDSYLSSTLVTPETAESYYVE